MFRFEHVEFLYGLIGVPIFLVFYRLYRYWRRKMLKQIGDANLVNELIPYASSKKSAARFFLMILAYSSIIVALANPQIGTKLEEVKREGVEIIIAVDLSNSMLSEDIKPNRLERTKQSILKLIDKLNNDKIGIIGFAGKSFLQLPLTTDYSAAKLLTTTLSTELISTQGTAIGSSIELAISSFSKSDKRNKALIIMTDGENHEDDALGAAKDAVKSGIIIHAIGVGTVNGGPIPISESGNGIVFKKDVDGATVISKLNQTVLEEIAQTGGGKFIRSDATDPDLASLVESLSKMDKQHFGSKVFTDYDDKFQIFLIIALIFILWEFLLNDKKNILFTRINEVFGRTN